MFVELTDEKVTNLFIKAINEFEQSGHKISDADVFLFCNFYTGDLKEENNGKKIVY